MRDLLLTGELRMNNYEIFQNIIKNGSISKTAQLLGYSQSSISHALMMLENDLGCTLLNRSRNGVSLTSDGKELLPYLNDVCNSENRLREKVDELHGLESGHIRVAAFTSTATQWLPYIINEFEKLYPGIEFNIMHGSFNEIERWLITGSADCAFVRIPTQQPFKTFFLKDDPFYAIIPTTHKYFNEKFISVEMLSKEPFIWQDDGDNEAKPFFDRCGLEPTIKYTAHDIYTVMAMVRVGLGVSLLSALATEGYSQILRKPLDIDAIRKIGIAVADNPSSATRKFVKHVREWVRKKYHTMD